MCNSNESYQGKIHQRYFCAGFAEGGKDGCAHDSGSPLMCNHGNSDPWYLVGMMIWGEGCARKNKYGVYANISQFLETIKQTVKGNFSSFCIAKSNGKRYLKHGGSVQVVFHNKLSWFVSELPEKDISNMVVQCR